MSTAQDCLPSGWWKRFAFLQFGPRAVRPRVPLDQQCPVHLSINDTRWPSLTSRRTALNDGFREVVFALGHRATSTLLLDQVVGDTTFFLGERPEVAERSFPARAGSGLWKARRQARLRRFRAGQSVGLWNCTIWRDTIRPSPALKPTRGFMLAGEGASQARLAVTQQSPRYGDLYGDQFSVLVDDLFGRSFNFHW